MTDPLQISATTKPAKKKGFFGLFGGGDPKPQPQSKANNSMSLLGLSASWSTEEAFCALLYATALVDGDVHAKEWEEIIALCHRVKVFEKKSDADVAAILDKVKSKLTWDRKSEFPWNNVESACAALAKKNLGLTVFANACDIVFADRSIEQPEVDMLNRMASKLGLEDGMANKIIEVIRIKNGHNAD